MERGAGAGDTPAADDVLPKTLRFNYFGRQLQNPLLISKTVSDD